MENTASVNHVPWHSLELTQIEQQLQSDRSQGLSEREALSRLEEFGPNALQRVGVRPWFLVLLNQFVDILILILLLAAAISVFIGQPIDAITILAVVTVNGCLGFVQEWRAERSLEALRRLLADRSCVVRDGAEHEINSDELVPGDLVRLEIGDRVPADLRLVQTVNFRADESALTGESVSVQKGTEAQRRETGLPSRRCMAWMGSSVANGYAEGLVVATGMATEFGRIATLTQTIGKERTPLQKRLGDLGKALGVISIVLSAAVAILGWALGRPLVEMFFTGVALAVAIVPEALPIVVTTTLALGIRTMVRKRALFRKLQAAETLGSATVICSDKTGTITTNEMTVTKIWLPSGEVDATGQGYDPAGHFESQGNRVDSKNRSDLLALLQTGLICNHARINKTDHGWEHSGEPTEAAIIVAAYKAWLSPNPELQRVSELSFNSERKRMTVIVRSGNQLVAHAKGAPEVILPRCSKLRDGDRVSVLNAEGRRDLEQVYNRMAQDGLRVLALATRELSDAVLLDEEAVESELVFLGFVGIIDPPRQEVAHAIQVAQQAGIRVLMITGDAAKTAQVVAERIGLKITRVLTGDQVSKLSDKELKESLEHDVLFARTSPTHKLRIIGLLQDQGEIVAMTGDGVNDAPALKKADIGIAMGMRGTDVARSAADMILTDDNFRSIVSAVDEGRRQFDNIRKFVRYILSAHMGEVTVIFMNILIGGPLILLPVQILWMNLVTDGMTAIALGLEPGEAGRMRRPPRDPAEKLPNSQGITMILGVGAYIALATAVLFYLCLRDGSAENVMYAQTVAFTGIIVLEKVNVFNFRSLADPLSSVGYFSNKWLLLAVAITLGAQICAVYVPFLQTALHTVPLSWQDWALMFAVAAPLFLIVELLKRRFSKSAAVQPIQS